jgi:hypothetical protein
MQIVSGALDEFTLADPEKQEFLALFGQRRDEVIDTQ